MDSKRYHEINPVKLIIKRMLQFNFVKDETFRTFARKLDHRDEFNPKMHSERVKKIVLEMYLACTERIRNDFSRVNHSCALSVYHINVDLWTSKTSNEKYFSLRLFFVNEQWELKAHFWIFEFSVRPLSFPLISCPMF